MRPKGMRTLLASALAAFIFSGIAVAKEVRSELKVQVGTKAPDFTLPASNGKEVKLSAFAGRIVLIDFYRGHW